LLSATASCSLLSAAVCCTASNNITGQYQIGLLVLDSSGGNAVAQKNIEVGPPVNDPRKQPRPPIIPEIDGPLEAEAGGELLLPAITDPNNDPVNVVWQIRQNNKLVKEGTGGNLVLDGVAPGEFQIQVSVLAQFVLVHSLP
jgi:hypothetical protein